jgi:kynureninase
MRTGSTSPSPEQMRALDAADPLRRFRAAFDLPAELIYLDGNSLGALPSLTPARLSEVVGREWGADLIRSWTANGWMAAPARVGGKIARLIGAGEHEVVVADSTSVNLFKLVLAALQARPDRPVILSEPGNFPTDLYIMQGAVDLLPAGRRLELRPRAEILAAIDDQTALVALTHVHYKTAEVHDLMAISARARARGALVLWDLSHSAGAVAVDLNGAGADLAVGCGYKYLNGGPGAPSFLFVAERHHDSLPSPLTGWMGHARPFDFSDRFEAAAGIGRFLVGTPSVLGLAALEVGVDLLLEAGMRPLVEKSQRLIDLFIQLAEESCAGFGLELASPRAPTARGSHLSFRHSQGYAIVQAMIAEGVIGDFRAPDILRFGITPLYLGYEDVARAVATLRYVLEERLWDRAEYQVRASVT